MVDRACKTTASLTNYMTGAACKPYPACYSGSYLIHKISYPQFGDPGPVLAFLGQLAAKDLARSKAAQLGCQRWVRKQDK